jgi:hypothetical protein
VSLASETGITPFDTADQLIDLAGRFDQAETEVSALLILRLMREKGDWVPFRLDELDELDWWGRYLWNGLDNPHWITAHRNGTFEVTAAFVRQCKTVTKHLDAPSGRLATAWQDGPGCQEPGSTGER